MKITYNGAEIQGSSSSILTDRSKHGDGGKLKKSKKEGLLASQLSSSVAEKIQSGPFNS